MITYMNNIDFDETLEFVWGWIAQFNAHLVENRWTYPENDVSKPGISPGARKDVADYLLKTIFNSPTPTVLMKALTMQLKVMTTTSEKYNIPHGYLVVDEQKGTGQWDSQTFTTALKKDIDDLLATLEVYRALGEQYLNSTNTVKHKM